jgi:hypothetical protein
MHFYCYNMFNLWLNCYYLTFLIKLMVGQQEITLFTNEIGWIQIESSVIKVNLLAKKFFNKFTKV